MNISELTPFGRKQWVFRRWTSYEDSLNTQAIVRSKRAYHEPAAKEHEDRIDKAKWKATVDKKVDYLLARDPIVSEHQDILDSILPFIKQSAQEYLLQGSLIWIVQGDGEEINPRPLIMNNTIAIYSDEYREEVVALIRKKIEIEIEPSTGEEQEIAFYECYYIGDAGWHRDTYCYTLDNRDTEETLAVEPVFIELGKTGDAPLYAYVEKLLEAFDKILKHQDTTVDKNTTPLTEVRGYSGSEAEDLKYAVENLALVKTEGAGGVVLHPRSMDSAAIDVWTKRLLSEYYEAVSVVGKDNESQVAQSGKAMDRLYVEMENSARRLALVLEEALLIYFEQLGYTDVDVIWNTDRPIDDKEIIEGIAMSQGILSKRTLLEQHPWVEDVEEEIERMTQDVYEGIEDLYDDNTEYNYDYELLKEEDFR